MRTLTQPLNMSPGGIPPVIHVSQYDSDFTIVFTLFSTVGDFTIESGTTAMVRGTKSSGTGYSADAAINISAKTVTVTGNAQMTAAAGQNVFEITLLKSGKEISSKNFILLCERAALDADTITDESVLKELNAIIESADTATQAADRAEAAAQSLVIDSTPTQGSTNAVSSGGVYDAVTGVADDVLGLKQDISAISVYRYAGEIAETGNGFISNAGVITAHSNYKYAKYILHSGTQKIIVDSMYVTGTASNYAAFAFFDSSDTLVSTVNNKTINTTNVGNTFTSVEADVPLNADYILITFGNMASSTTFSTITEIGLYKPATNKRVFNNGLNNVNKQFFYFHTTASELGSYTSLAFNAKFKTESPALSYEVYFTGYDADYTNRVFAIYKTGLTKGVDGNTVTIAENFQDTSKSLSSKTYIGVVVNFLYAYSSETGARTGISNANLYAVTSEYCMLNNTELELAHYPASGFTTLSTDYAEHYNPLYGGFLCAIGDSLTGVYYKAESETWVALIAKWNNMQYENHGVSGNPMAKPDGYTSKCMAERVDDLSATKYYSHIFVMGGANDYNERIPIGKNTDTEIATFKGAVNHIITTLTQKFPNAHIVFATTYRRNQSYADKPYADAMLEVCALHSIPCLNNYENSGVQFFDANWMAIYGATNALGNNHLNAAGDLFVAPRFEHALKYGLNADYAGVTDSLPTQGSTNVVSSGGVYSALDGKIDKSSILVEDHGEGEQVTLTNAENASDFYENLSNRTGFEKTSLLDGIALFTSTANSDPNPYVRHDFNKGIGKWLVGCKFRFVKVDSTLENPTSFKVTIGSSTAKDFSVSWNTWIDYSNVAEIDLTRMIVSARGFVSARTAGQFTLEVKDVYIYEVTGVSDEMIARIQSEQSANYQDGTVTYGEASTTSYSPDTSLTKSGKVPDSKAVGDAIALAQSTAEGKVEEAVSRINTKISDVISETSTTLTNASRLSNLVAQNGFQRDSITTNLAVYSPSSHIDVSPAILDSCALGSGKWLVGFKFRITKNDSSLGDPEMIRLILGSSDRHDYAVVYDTWVNVCEVSDVNLTRVYFMLRNYATAPTAGQITLEVKDYYVYEVSNLSADLLNYIKNQQETTYTDGEVTYSVSEIADPIRLNLGRVNAKNYGIKGDGVTDDTVAINAMFNAVGSGNYYFPAGTYLFSGTIYPPADSTIYGDGDTTVFQLADTHNLSQESFRGSSGGWHPYFDAVNIDNLNIRKIKIVGSNNLDNARHAAILLKWCKKCSVSEVTVYNVNFDDDQVADATVSGYGIAVDMSEKCSVEKCYVERCGYECIGIVDLCSDCVVRDCVTKNGWRTCIQIHRGSKRTIVDNCWMEETHNACDACFTIHGLTDVNLVEDVRVTNCTMIYPSGITQAYDYNAPAQCMSHTNRFWFCNNRIYGGRRALYVDASFADVFVCNNEMYCDSDSDYGVTIRSAEAIIIGNRLKNDASSPVNVIASDAVISANIGIS